jgi:hypothetical protein
MPQLDWDEIDFLECLGIIPSVEDYEVKHTYKVNRSGLVLTLIVKQLDSLVQIALQQQDLKEPVVALAFFVRGSVRYINDKRGRYLEFVDSIIAPDNLSQILGAFDKTKFPRGMTIQLQVNPEIHIRMVQD